MFSNNPKPSFKQMKKINHYRYLQLIIVIIGFSNSLLAQKTGKFEEKINFSNADHTLAYYVPKTYDADKSYPLVIALHGCNGNGISFRNSLISVANTLDAIVVGPDFMGEQMHGNKGKIIISAIDKTINQYGYKVNEDQVYLLGYSCNGLETYKHGWGGMYPFAGIIPFNAWIPSTTEGFNFDSKTPTCACSGTKDGSYSKNSELINKLNANQGKGMLVTMDAIGHSWNFESRNQFILNCFDWFKTLKD